MFKVKKSFFAAVALGSAMAAVATTANAQEAYLGGNLALVEYSEDGIGEDASVTAGYVRFGGFLNEYLSVEARAGLGFDDDRVNVSGIPVDFELDNLLGGYLRAGYPVTDQLYPYVVGGFTRVEATVSVEGFGSETDSGNDVSYGLGADFAVTEAVKLNAEYISFYSKDGADFDALSFGVSTSF